MSGAGATPHTRWRGQQRRIGLTGGIATGKSSVGHWLAEQGIPVLDADHYAREALAPGSPGSIAVLARYGPRVGATTCPTEINRKALAQVVFNDAQERQWLESLVHPQVRSSFEAALQRNAKEPVVVLMIPLLFETGLEVLCSEIWVIACSTQQQTERLMAREQLNTEEAAQRIQAQWSLERKTALADEVIDNNGAPGAWQQQVASLL